MALVERETSERRKLRRLTTELQPQPPTGQPFPPLAPPDEAPSAFDIFKKLPILPGGGGGPNVGKVLQALDQAVKPFEALTQGARQISGRLPQLPNLPGIGGPIVGAGQRALEFGRKPEEERRKFKPTGNLFSDFNQVVELEREEPFLAQLVGGAVTDPTVGFGGGKAAAKIGKEVLEQAPTIAKALAKEQTGAITLDKALTNIRNRAKGISPDTAPILDDLGKDSGRVVTVAQREADNLNLSVAKVNDALVKVAGKRKNLTRAQHVERKKRVSSAQEKLLEFDDPNEAFAAARAELKGELAPRVSDELVDLIDDVDITRMANHIRNTDTIPFGPRGFFQRENAYDALRKFTIGEILQRNEIKLLGRLFGPDLEKALLKERSWIQVTGNVINEAVNLPRVMITGIWDMSMPLRQGAVVLPNHPIRAQQAAGKMFKAFFSEKVAMAVDEGIELHPRRDLMEDAELSITKRIGPLSGMEENVMSNWIRTIPILKTIAKVTFDPASRAAHTFLNKLRVDVFDDFVRKQLAKGKTFESHPEDFKAYARFLNWATGRGPIPTSLEKFTPFLNGLLFSPRLLTSRFALPAAPLVGPWRGEQAVSKVVRAQIAKELVVTFTTGMAIMGLMWRIPGVELEMDPRSSDFGQGKIQGTRFDIWAGFRPIANLFAKLGTGETKSPISDQVKSQDWQTTIGRFVQSKLAPVPGFGVDVVREETFLGESLETPKDFRDDVVKRLVPLFIQDTLEAYEEDGLLLGAGAGVGAFFGLGTTSFSGLTNTLQEGADALFNKNWRDLSPRQKDEVRDLPDSQAKILEIDERSRGVAPQTQTTNAFDQLSRIRQEQNDELLEQLRAGRRGIVLRKSLQSTKTELWAGSQALFSPEVEVFLKKDEETAMEELRRRYWTASALENPATGELDFAHQDKQRNEVLEQAKDFGIDPALVKERSRVFENDSVQGLMDLWNRDLGTLRTIWKGSNDMVRGRLSPERQEIWDDFLSERSTNRKSQLRKQHPWISKALTLRNNLRKQARAKNPDLDRIFIRWEYSIVPRSEGGARLQEELFPLEP